MSGRKRKLKNNQIETLYCPQYENLSLKCIGEFVGTQPHIELYLPDPPDLAKAPKQWIVNVCAAVIGAPFKAWVKQQVEDRNTQMADKKEMMISMDPEMAAAF